MFIQKICTYNVDEIDYQSQAFIIVIDVVNPISL